MHWALESLIEMDGQCPKLGTFGKSVHVQVPKNGTSGARNQKWRIVFMLTSPKNDRRDIGFVQYVYAFWMDLEQISKFALFAF